MSVLIVNADDYGYHPAYDAGILEAARGGALDAVSAMVTRPGLHADPLLATGVEVGLHLELDPGGEGNAEVELGRQFDRFEAAFGRPPAYVDGHHHCHLGAGVRATSARLAAARGIPIRSVTAADRELIRRAGGATADLAIGRMNERDRVLPAELDARPLPPVVEWIVHPGHASGTSFSSYDAGREEDLAAVLDFSPPEGMRRADHRTALGLAA